MRTKQINGITIRKHWIAYTKPMTLIVASLFLYFLFFSKHNLLANISKTISILTCFVGIFKVIEVCSVKYILNVSELHVIRGAFLFKRKTKLLLVNISLTSAQQACNKKFINAGHIKIKSDNKKTYQFNECSMHNAEDFCNMINIFILDSKNIEAYNYYLNNPNLSIGCQLKKVAYLKKMNMIELSEYEKIKRELIDLRHL